METTRKSAHAPRIRQRTAATLRVRQMAVVALFGLRAGFPTAGAGRGVLLESCSFWLACCVVACSKKCGESRGRALMAGGGRGFQARPEQGLIRHGLCADLTCAQ